MTRSFDRDDLRLTRFLDELQELQPDQWLAICRRYLGAEEAIGLAAERAYDLAADIALGRVEAVNDRPGEEWREVIKQAEARAAAITAGLAETVDAEGTEIPLRETAKDAVWSATMSLIVWDELTNSKRGAKIAQRVLAPFDGFVDPG